MNNVKTFYDVRDVESLLDCKIAKAYQVIKTLNDELKEQGSMITPGKIPVSYFHKRFKEIPEGVINDRN